MKLGFTVVGNSRVAQTIKLVRLGDFQLKANTEDALNYLKIESLIQNLSHMDLLKRLVLYSWPGLGFSMELHQRLRHVHFPLKSKELHLSVVNEVKAKFTKIIKSN